MLFRGIIGALLVLVGGVWFFQGIGVLHGSPMTGESQWTVIGAIAVVAGIALLVWAALLRGHPADPSHGSDHR